MRLGHRGLVFAALMLAPALCAAQAQPASAAAAPAVPAVATPASAPAAAPKPAEEARADIVLLLPMKSSDFQGPAEALRLGFMVARDRAERRWSVMVRGTEATTESIVAEYDAAVKGGARVVVGPLTRTGVSAIAALKRIGVPTLALNYPEGGAPLPDRLYAIGLSVELEARLSARHAWFSGLRQAAVVTAASPLARRTSQAFAAEWQQLGGKLATAVEFTPQSDLATLRERMPKYNADMIFLAADAEQAVRVRPFLGGVLPTYATSLLNSGPGNPLANVDLNGIRFVDMPWLVQPDHPAVMAYPRPAGLSPEGERFYALGIDAFRVATELAQNRPRISVDGVTGRLSLSGNFIDREPVEALFRDGAAVAVDNSR